MDIYYFVIMKNQLISDAMGLIFLEEDDLKVFMPSLEENCRTDKRRLIQPLYSKLTSGEITSQQLSQKLGIVNPTLDFLMNVTLDENFCEFAGQIGNSRQVSVLSNDSQEWADYRNGRLGLNKIVARYFTSGFLRVRKPSPEAWEKTCVHLGTEPRNCFYIDNLAVNLSTARDVGMDVVLFRRDGRNDSCYPLVRNFQELSAYLGVK